MDDNHGGGCGAQAGEATGWTAVGWVMEGSGARPAGLPMPLLKGAKEAPMGLANGAEESEFSQPVCGLKEGVSSGAVTAAAGVELGFSNCMNWLISDCG